MTRSFRPRFLNLASLLFVAVLALGGCSAMVAQNPDSALKPVNAVARVATIA
jgi:hypothetical protein